MLPRAQLIAVLVAIEIAIIGGIVISIRGDDVSAAWPGSPAAADSGSRLVEGGPAQSFDAGEHPALTVDIGYADLTIITRDVSQIAASVSKSTDFGYLRETAPITAVKNGATLQIATVGSHGWVIGDNRMVTVIVPPETQVTIVNAGDITANGLRAAATIKSNNGDVAIADYDAPSLSVKTTMNGDLDLRRIVTSRLDAASRSGNVQGTALQVRDGRIESNHGRVTLGFAAGTNTLVTADTDGTVRVRGFAASTSSTSVHKSSSSSDDEDDDDDDDSGSSLQTVRIGSAEGRLDVHSNRGNIDLVKEN